MKTISRGPSLIAITTLWLFALLALLGLTLVTLWLAGVNLLFWLPKPTPEPTGHPLPVLTRSLPAYTKIKLEHLIDPQTKTYAVSYVPTKEEAERMKFIMDVRQLLGRVLTRDKDAGFPFVEKDLYPAGTRAGIVAGIPPGKVGFVLAADKIQGIHHLKTGDQFDLLGSLPFEAKPQAKFTSIISADSLNIHGTTKQAKVRPLVQNGTVVLAVAIREVPTGAAAKGGKIPTKPLQEVTIAVEPTEVAPLQEALAVNASLVCVGRSGHVESAKENIVTPGSAPPPPIRAMETIVSGKRQMLVFPTPGGAPVETPPSVAAGEETGKK